MKPSYNPSDVYQERSEPGRIRPDGNRMTINQKDEGKKAGSVSAWWRAGSDDRLVAGLQGDE